MADVAAIFWKAVSAISCIFAGARPEGGGTTLGIQVIRAGKSVTLYWNLAQQALNRADGAIAPSTYDPSSPPAITIIDPNGIAQVSAATMAKIAAGVYAYEYVTSSGGALGTWSAWVDTFDAAENPAGSAYQAGQSKATPVFQLV